ncbi:MAG TPA: endonuclease/exonuclease/phosphatase family protein, partial [Solirubrobacteraceae bacterium]|nr:endonuclease/exonuclease/phosphatase family protein [Solirubrobacteraceae bacterium]
MRVLTWNLFHGRAQPPAGRDLQADFAAALAGWQWDVALLQEVPPWWAPALARACDADHRTALTSRNALLVARRFVARRWPDVIKSNGGGANVILVRRGGAGASIIEHRRVMLRRWPERRVCHAVALDDGPWCANLHAQVRPPERARADIARAAAATLAWAQDGP